MFSSHMQLQHGVPSGAAGEGGPAAFQVVAVSVFVGADRDERPVLIVQPRRVPASVPPPVGRAVGRGAALVRVLSELGCPLDHQASAWVGCLGRLFAIWSGMPPGHPGGTVTCRLTRRQCPQGPVGAVLGRRVRAYGGSVSGRGVGRVGRPSLPLLFSVPGARGRGRVRLRSPGLRAVCFLGPALLSLGGRSRCPRRLVPSS